MAGGAAKPRVALAPSQLVVTPTLHTSSHMYQLLNEKGQALLQGARQWRALSEHSASLCASAFVSGISNQLSPLGHRSARKFRHSSIRTERNVGVQATAAQPRTAAAVRCLLIVLFVANAAHASIHVAKSMTVAVKRAVVGAKVNRLRRQDHRKQGQHECSSLAAHSS